MDTLKFKTNIKCGGCIAAVTPVLDANPAIDQWKVDTDQADKILTVEGNADPKEIISSLKEAGYTAEEI